MKRLKKKGEPFEELAVVKSAGFAKGKRRDKSINKKAGLHDKTVSKDQTRVYRCKPLAVKHKRRLRKVLPALLALISIAMVIIITGSYMPPVDFDDLEGDYRTVYFEVPNDSSSPENHTVVETIGYLNYTLQNQPYWSSEMEQSLSAMFNIKQSTYNYKKYYNNTLISVDIAKGASTSAKQFCQTDKVVLWRDAVDVNNTNGFYTNWKTGQPAGLTVSEFRKKRGLPPAEFSVYVLNENTILNAQENGVVKNDDGTYSVTVNLNVNTKGGEENDMCSAVYYYKQQMAVTGGLSQLPTYDYTNVTYVFDADYRVLSFEIRDKYEATLRITGLGEVTSGCTSTTKTVFSYEIEDCINSVYDDFKPYLNDFGEGDDKEPEFSVSATNCLAGAFASVLSDGAVFKLDLGLGGKTVEGVVGVALKDGGLDSVALQLGNITAHVLNGQDGYVVYLALGSSKYKVSLSELDLSASMGNVEFPATDGEGEGDLLSNLLDSLLGGDFAYDSQKGLATLDSDISLFGIDININFAFSVDEEKEEISLIDVKAKIKYGKIDLDATLKFGDESDKPADLTAADKVIYKDILNDGVTAGIDLALGESVIKGVAKIDLLNGEFVGLRAKLGEITVHYDGANLYISNGDSKYKLGLDSLGGSVELSAGLGGGFNSILSGVLENLTIEDGIIKAQIFGLDISVDLFGGIKVSAYYDAFGGIGVDAYLSNDPVPAQLTEQDKAAYTDILNDGVTVGVDLTLGEKVIKGVAKIDLLNGEFVGLRAKLGEITVHYDGANLYISSGDSKYKLGLDSLGGSVELPASLGGGFNSILSGVLENLTIEDGIIKAQIYGLDISVDLFGGIKVSAYYDAFGGIAVDAYLSNDSVPARLTETDKANYTDILNDGVTAGVDLTLGDEVINGVAKIDLLNGEFVGLRAKLGEITVHYDGASLYISSGDSKYKLGLDSLGGSVELSAGVDFDINSLLSGILENLTIEDGIIKAQIYGLDISVDLFGGIKVSAYYDAFGGIGVDAYLSNDSVPAQLTETGKANYTDILNDGVTVGVDLTLGEKVIKGVAKIDLLNGEFVGLRAKLGEITVHYDGANLYISSGDSKYKLGLDSLGGSVELSAGVEFDITSLLCGILENLTIEDGIIKVQIYGLDVSVDLFGGIKVSAYYDAFGGIGVDAYLSNDSVPAQLTETDKANYTDILNDGVTVEVDLTLGDEVIKGVAKVDLSNGEFVGLRAKLGEITVHYDGANLYISSGDSKYKLGLDSLGGSVELPAGLGGDFNSILSGVLENLTIEDGIIKTQIYGLDISVDLFGGIKVSAYYDAFGGIAVDAYLSNDSVPAQLTETDKANYTDILNDGVTVGVDLTLGDEVIKGVAKIDLLNGEFVGLRAKLGEITVHYDGANLYISSGDSKYKLGLDSLGGSVELPAGLGGDFNSILSGVLENLTIEDGIIKTQIFGLDISVDLFSGIKVSAYYDAFGGIGVDAYLSNDSVPARLTETDKANYTDILNDGVTVGVSLTIDGKLINGVAKVDLSNGEFVGLRAKLGDAVVHYEDDILYISVSGSKIKLPISALGGATVNTEGSNLNGLIKDILNGVHIENGIINTVLFGADVSLDIFGGIKAEVLYEIFNAKIKASATLLPGGAPASLTADEKSGYVDVTQGFSLSGMLGVTLGGEQISLAVNNLAVSFENSFSFKLDTTLLLNNTYNNFYIEYLNGVLTVTYGAVSPMPMSMDGAEVVYDVISVRLDLLGGDLEVLEKEIVNVYNRIVAVYNEIAKQNVQAAGELQDILDMLGIAQDGVNGMSEIFEKLALPVKDGKLDMQTLLKTIAIASTQEGISVTLGNIFAEFALKSSGVNCGANIRFGTSSFDLTISDVIVDKYCDFEVPCESPLDRYGFTELLDYLGATAEMLLQHNISLDLSGTIYDYDASYSEYGNIKYIFNALLEYDDGGSMPVTFEDGQLYVSNDLYLHAKLDLVAQNTKADDSLYLDVYILDGYPGGTDDNGFTTGGYKPDDTGLDFYVSVSKLAEGTSGYNPLKFYGSMNEVLSIASMGVAMLNLQDINTTSDKVNETVASIYGLLNGMLIENYIPSVKSQFASLGESLIPNILGTDLSTLLNKLIAEYERVMDGVEHKTEITEGNFIKMATYADGRLDVALNSATLFGVPEYEDLTFYITKTEGERSLISGLGINNIYFGDNGVNKLNLAAGITYNPVSKPDSATAFKNYHNFEGLDKLLLTAVNSATHETTDEERANGYFADYKLNNDYCVDGNITLKILGKEIPIKINTLHINIDENNEVSFNINLSHDRATFLGMELLTDSATVDISIKKDMVYVKKAIEGGATSYRIMPSNVFMNDMFNQLSYILSFGDTINNLADQFMSGSSEKVMPEFKDYGDYISKFVNVYTYSQSENSSEWTITANGNTLGGLAGMSGLKDIEVKFKGENGVLNTLTLNGGLSIITFSGTLNYINPNEKFVDGKSDLSNNVANLVADGLYYSWTEILGGETFDEIYEHLNWESIPDNPNYLSYEYGKIYLGNYIYVGASHSIDNGYAIGSFANLKECGIDLANTQPIWMKADIGMSAKRDIAGWKKYKYTIVANSINIDFIGNAEVIDKISVSGVAFGYANDSEAYEPNSSRSSDVTLQFTGGNGSFSHAGISFGAFTTDYKSYGQVAVNLSLDCNGYRLDTWAHSFVKLPLI